MPPRAESDPLCAALLPLCGAVAAGIPWPAANLPADLDLEALQERVTWHELAALRSPDDVTSMGQAFPPDVLDRWQREYRHRIARNLLALKQLEEIAAAFAGEQVRLIALKGAATLLWLYDTPGIRSMADLDLLVEETAVPAARRIMEGMGYTPQCFRSSQQEEELLLKLSHLQPYVKPGRLPVEIHINILHGRGNPDAAVPELWRRAVPVNCGRAPLQMLSPGHFLLHTIAHFMKDVEVGVASMNKLVDLLVVVVRQKGVDVDWVDFWATADRWEIGADAATLMVTLNEHWDAGVPGVSLGATPLSAATLVYGLSDTDETLAIRQAADYLAFLAAARETPSVVARLRYLLRLIFPAPKKLACLYGVQPGVPLALYYVRRPFYLAGRLGKGLIARARQSRRRGYAERP